MGLSVDGWAVCGQRDYPGTKLMWEEQRTCPRERSTFREEEEMLTRENKNKPQKQEENQKNET